MKHIGAATTHSRFDQLCVSPATGLCASSASTVMYEVMLRDLQVQVQSKSASLHACGRTSRIHQRMPSLVLF